MSCSWCKEIDDLLECWECEKFVCKNCIVVIGQFIDRVYCDDCMGQFIKTIEPSKKRKRSDVK